MDEKKMFCFQCQETAMGSGCTVKGVCGKSAETSASMDTLLAVTRAVGTLVNLLADKCCNKEKGEQECYAEKYGGFITDALFSTITNANFDNDSIKCRIENGIRLRDELAEEARKHNVMLPDYPEMLISYDCNRCEMDDANKLGVLRYNNNDVRSLKEMTMYGLKGIAAYYEHAARLGHKDSRIIKFMCHALAEISNSDINIDELVNLVLDTGKCGVDVMALLDKANCSTYGPPEITKVNIGVGNKPGILISGHDLHDIEDLLIQAEGKGIDVYTHSEMLPAHYYPKLKRYKCLKGNYGNAWWRQREEFEKFNGPIIFTTNCIVPPLKGATYNERVFTLNSTGYPGWKHIPTDADGHKDFSSVIALAAKCEPPIPIESGEIVGGFAHSQVLALADKIVDAIKSGAIKRFVVMSGCDGRMKSREYYSDFARTLPKDTVILTSGCAKYRYIKQPLGNINGIPRVLDAGQCNDSFSWVVVAMKLKEIFGAESINELPIVFNIAWYEQKAVIVLLALLSLGIKNIHIGPTLPAFLSPNVLKLLQDKFGLSGITTVSTDMTLFGF